MVESEGTGLSESIGDGELSSLKHEHGNDYSATTRGEKSTMVLSYGNRKCT